MFNKLKNVYKNILYLWISPTELNTVRSKNSECILPVFSKIIVYLHKMIKELINKKQTRRKMCILKLPVARNREFYWFSMKWKRISEFPPDSFRRALRPACPFIEWISFYSILFLVAPHSNKLSPSCPLVKNKKKGAFLCLFRYELCHVLLNLKVPLEQKICTLEYQKCPFLVFSILPFFEPGENC